MRSRIMRTADRPTKQAPEDYFTGVVWQDQIFLPEEPSRLRVTRVSFTPGARTNWHTHAVGQVLYVLSGTGRYQLEGEAVQELLPGETVIIPADARHWHGASPDHLMVHLALSKSNDKGESTEWLEPVSNADYSASPGSEG